MTDINEQRRKVEELKRKILEQKKKSDAPSTLDLSIKKHGDVSQEQIMPVQSQAQKVKQQDGIENQHRIEVVNRKLEETVLQQKEEEKVRTGAEKVGQVQHTIPVVSLQAYAQTLRQAWANGSLSKDEEDLLLTLRKSMGINDEEHVSLEQEIRLEIYLQAIVDSWKNGSITPQDLDRLDTLREKFNISAEEHMKLEKQVRQEILRQH